MSDRTPHGEMHPRYSVPTKEQAELLEKTKVLFLEMCEEVGVNPLEALGYTITTPTGPVDQFHESESRN